MLSLFNVSYGKGVYAVMFGLCVALLIGPLMLPGHALAAGEGGDDGALCIAVAGPMSGPEKRHGEETVKIVKMRVERFNKSGGVNGKKIRVLAFDDKNDIENAEKAARKIAGNNNILLVIGHRYSGASIAAGRIYKKHRIPVITATATAEMVTRDNDWSFRTVFNNQQQGSLLATYVCRILGRNIASIIYDEDAFGRGLTKSFEDASQEFGLTVNYKWGFDRKRDDLEKQLSDIVDELKEARNCGIVFLAVHERAGASLIRKIRELGLNVPLIGSDALAKQSFPLQFNDFPMEKLNPGFSTNDLHVASYYLSDTADLDGKRVHNEYVATFKKEPDASAMTTYDAISLGLEAIGKTGAKETDPARRRKKIRDFLAGVNGMNSAYKGVTGYIYFDEEGDAQKSVPVGVFKNNRLISAPVQLSPVKDFKEIGSAGVSGMADGLVYGPGEGREKKDDDVLFINGMHLRKTNYVYTGIEVNEINALDADNLLFDMDFYLWLRFQEGVEPWRIEFVNATEPIELKEHIAEEKSGRIIYRKYHVKGRFRADFLSRPPKFGQHILGVGFRHQHLTRDKMVYIVDELGMGMTGDARSKKGSNRFLGAASGWAVSRVNFFQDIQEKNSMGDPRYLSARHGKINYSRFNLEIAIKKIQVTLRGVVKSLPANYALCLTSALIILLAAVCGRNEKYEDSMKLVVLARMVCTGVFFLGAETLLLDALTGKTGVYNLERIQLAFDILWWLAPAYFLNLGFRQFIIYPLEKRTERKVPSLLIYFIKFIVYILAFFGIIAFVFDQRLTSLLATSGVLAMIIGLAVQINISNIFSGIAINLERPFRVGDSVKIGSEQGKVVDITWRTTRISTIMGNIISIPNSNASETVVVNYSYPDDTHWHGFDLNLDHNLDPDHIIAILEEAVVSVEGVLAPAVTFNGFTEWSANYLVYFQIRDYSQRNAFIELVWKSVWKQLKSEGIKPAIKHHKLVQEIRVDGDSKIPALPVAS